MMVDLTDNPLPTTDLKATIEFSSRSEAEKFAIEYARKTLMGHTISGTAVTVYNVTDEVKAWIDGYVKSANELNAILDELDA